MRGKLITIEGIDGSGKGTQAKMLCEKLLDNSIPAKLYSFPSYENTFFGKEVGAFLRGEFGSIESVHPKLASILFAGDRFEKKHEIQADLNDGIIVICDRYVDSNIAHQCAKLPSNNRYEFCSWLEDLEYNVFGMPKADIVLLLDVPLNISKEMVLKKAQRNYTDAKEDIHESAYGYLEEVFSMYLELGEKRGWHKIECIKNSKIREPAEINQIIFDLVTT